MNTFKTTTTDGRKICAISFDNETDMKVSTDSLIEAFRKDGEANTSDAYSHMKAIANNELRGRTFYGENVRSYDDAAGLLLNGYNKELKSIKAKYDGANAAAPAVVKTLHYCGAVPSVADYLAGRPRDMRRTVTATTDKVLTVYVDTGISCFVKADDAIEAAGKIAAYIGGLEKAGYRINLHAAFFGKEERERVAIIDLKLKDARNRANVARYMFPLCHPAFLRVFGVAQLSKNPVIECLADGLGRPIKHMWAWRETLKAVLPEGAQVISLQSLIDGENIDDQLKAWKEAKPTTIKYGVRFRA